MNNESFSQRLKLLRGGRKLHEFASYIGININTLRGYESGQRTPAADTILIFCQKTNAEPRWLLSGEGPMFESRESISSDSEKSGDISPFSGSPANQHTENIDTEKTKSGDRSPLLDAQHEINTLNRELRDLLRENGDLRVDIERKNARIAELERELVRVLKGEEASPVANAG